MTIKKINKTLKGIEAKIKKATDNSQDDNVCIIFNKDERMAMKIIEEGINNK